jgi:hypothetical protein
VKVLRKISRAPIDTAECLTVSSISEMREIPVGSWIVTSSVTESVSEASTRTCVGMNDSAARAEKCPASVVTIDRDCEVVELKKKMVMGAPEIGRCMNGANRVDNAPWAEAISAVLSCCVGRDWALEPDIAEGLHDGRPGNAVFAGAEWVLVSSSGLSSRDRPFWAIMAVCFPDSAPAVVGLLSGSPGT